MARIPGLSFSLKRAIGISGLKTRGTTMGYHREY